jgi:hypothetical protein
MNKRHFTLFPRLGVTCSAGRSPRSPAAFSGLCVIWSATRAPRLWSGQQPDSPAPFPRKKGKASRSNKGGANAV